MNIHILGICGTFMGGLALLARASGHRVSGSDANVYPPMSDQLATAGIPVFDQYDPAHLEADTDLVVIGNALARGNPAIEAVLNSGVAYTSGPQWLAEHVLSGRTVIAVAGTHGKTTTSSMLAWILSANDYKPGFLIGGVPQDFGHCAQLGESEFFVIEADEYDSAFFDKRSKFVHYRPRILILNNLEYDHADIFPDLAAIQRQFHHLLRCVPSKGQIIVNQADQALAEVLAMGCWTPLCTFGLQRADWTARFDDDLGSRATLSSADGQSAPLQWQLNGEHNLLNATAAATAAAALGIPVQRSAAALSRFSGVKRRLEQLTESHHILVLDDFAHHPSAIGVTLRGLRQRYPGRRLVVAIDPRSYTMRSGVHAEQLGAALAPANWVLLWQHSDLKWSAQSLATQSQGKIQLFDHSAELLDALRSRTQADDVVVFMSNGSFDGIAMHFAQSLADS